MEHKEFIKIWQTCNNMQEVVEATGMEKKAVGVKASRLRAKGIPLKVYKRSLSNIDELKAYAQSFLNGDKHA